MQGNHRQLRVFLKSIVTLALFVGLVGCAGGPTHVSTEKYYLVATNIEIQYWKEATAGFYKAARELGVQAEVVGPKVYDPQGQVEEFRKLIQAEQKPAGILVSVASEKLMTPVINQAIEMGIPVITIDSDAPSSKRLFFIGTDNYQVGVTAAQIVVDALGGAGNVVVYTMPDQPNLRDRLRGYQSVFDQFRHLRIADIIDIKGDPRVAFDTTMEIVNNRRRLENIDAFVCLEALAGKEVAEVLDRNHVKDKIIMAMDTDDMTLEWIRQGRIIATIAQKPYTMGYYGLRLLADLVLYKIPSLTINFREHPFSPLPVFVDTGSTVVNKNNLDEFLKLRKEAMEAPAPTS